MNKQEKKLRKYIVKAEECTDRNSAQKILGKVKKTLTKIAKKLEELS